MTNYEEVKLTPANPHLAEEVNFKYKTTYQGKARIDVDLTGQAIHINDLAQLDRDRWFVVGISLHPQGCRTADSDTVRLYAVDREAAEKEGRNPLALNDQGELEVIDILCHDISVEDIFRNVVTTQIEFKAARFADTPLRVTAYADRPNQED